jgi:hypothetical protein
MVLGSITCFLPVWNSLTSLCVVHYSIIALAALDVKVDNERLKKEIPCISFIVRLMYVGDINIRPRDLGHSVSGYLWTFGIAAIAIRHTTGDYKGEQYK